MDDRRNLLVDLHRLPNGALVVAAGGHEAARSTTGDAGGSALIVASFSFHSLDSSGRSEFVADLAYDCVDSLRRHVDVLQQSLRQRCGGFGFVVTDDGRAGLHECFRLIDVLGAGDDPHQWRNFACGLDDTQADVGVRHRDDEVSCGIEPGGAQNVRSRGIAEKRLLSALLEFKDNVDICLEDDGLISNSASKRVTV